MSERPLAASALIFLAGVFVFASPLSGWLIALGPPWYAIFLPWAVLIALVALEEHGGRRRPPRPSPTRRDGGQGVGTADDSRAERHR